jgi:hypothetical protein
MSRRKPHNPVEDMRLRLERAAALSEAKRLEATGVDVSVVTELVKEDNGRLVKRWVAKGHRKDVFRVLLDRRALDQSGFDAIRRYEEAVETAAGHNTPERRPDHIKGTPEGAPGQNIGQHQILASHRARWIEDRLCATDLRMLILLRMNVPAQWRHIVQMVTGETDDKAQAARVRAMAQGISDGHASFDRLSRKAA